MTRALAIAALMAFALSAAGCASVNSDAATDWSAADGGKAAQESYAAGKTLSTKPTISDSKKQHSSTGSYLLDSGDRIRVTVYGEPDLSKVYMIDPRGRITLPLIGGVEARGRSTTRLSQSIANRLGATYIREPQVAVNIDQHRPFYILGEVRGAGQYPYVSGMTVEAAIATAGGYTQRANQQAVRLTRNVKGSPAVVDVPSDFLIEPGDSIYVREGFIWPTVIN